MNPKILQWMSKLPALLTLAVIATAAQAQTTAASLSGTITGPSGAAVANARVSVRNTLTGQTAYSAIFAPKVPGTKVEGPIRVPIKNAIPVRVEMTWHKM